MTNETQKAASKGADLNGINNEHKKILTKDSKDELVRALLCCHDSKELRSFLIDLCTPQEIETLAERLVIARLLDKGGMSYRDISAATGASTTTVGRVARFLQQEPHKGYQLVLERIEEGDDAGRKGKKSG